MLSMKIIAARRANECASEEVLIDKDSTPSWAKPRPIGTVDALTAD